MTLLAMLFVAAVLVAACRHVPQPRRSHGVRVLSPGERVGLYESRLDDETGLNSETHLRRVARGIAVKRALLAGLRIRAAQAGGRGLPRVLHSPGTRGLEVAMAGSSRPLTSQRHPLRRVK
jgi:hypothetical protein